HPREIVEALVAAGADREYFADKDKLESFAHALTTPLRTVAVQRDEEHNRYLLQVDDRATGYPRHHAIGVDFVTAGEYRTLLANHREIPAFDGDIIVTTAAGAPPVDAEGDDPAEAPETKTKQKAAPPDVRLHSIDELVDYFILAGKKGIAVNRYK